MLRLPSYRLYGESDGADGIDWLHCETIAERSRLHNWKIRPHRHEALTQLLHIARGRAEVRLDERVLSVDGPALIVVPSPVVHGFRFAADTEGQVVTIHKAHLATLLSGEPALQQALARPSATALRRSDAAAKALHTAVSSLSEEFLGNGSWRKLALDGATLRLTVAAARLLADAHSAPVGAGSRARSHLERFKDLIEREFRQQPRLSTLAAQLGITTTQLNRVCRQELGHTALALLQARIVLEAKRELSYTTLSIKQVAHQLGFADAAYFTRFFQRETALTPTQWRAQGPARAPVASAQSMRASPQKL